MTPALQQAMDYIDETRDLTPDEVGRIIEEAMKAPHEMSSEELAGLRYDNGVFYLRYRCAAGVRFTIYEEHDDAKRQCNRKPGHGPGGLYCKQHAKRWEVNVPRDLFVTEHGGGYAVYEQTRRGVYEVVDVFDTADEAYRHMSELQDEATP